MFPIKDNIPSRRRPWVNVGLILANAVVFGMELAAGPHLDRLIHSYGYVPARLFGGGADGGIGWLAIFTSMFLHGSLFHLVANMWMLWIFGDNVEDRMGHRRFLLFYLLCGVAAAMLQTGFAPRSTAPMIGASGAISGVVGAYVLLYPRARILTFIPVFILFYLVEIPAFFFIGFWFVLQFLQGAAQHVSVGSGGGGVAWWAHVGGFLAGLVLVRFFAHGPLFSSRSGRERGSWADS